MSPLSRRHALPLLLALSAGRTAAEGPSPAGAAGARADDDAVRRGRPLRFPRDHGAHPGSRIEWWYATGWLGDGDGQPQLGFQLTFFRSRTGLATTLAGRLAPRQLLFGHAALTDLAARRHRHAQRLARWSGAPERSAVHAARDDARLVIGSWRLDRDPASGRWHAELPAPEAGFTLSLELVPTQALLRQGVDGWSAKGPQPEHASHYYSLPQLAVAAELQADGRSRSWSGRGWLDHEWSDSLLAAEAVGWDWIGINLADGSALTAFQLRRADGTAWWAGGSHRAAHAAEASRFEAGEVRFVPEREWNSPASGARYPVRWRVDTPAGRFVVEALLDAQELDSRASTGAIYWEGLAEARDGTGRRIGLGYLEMTGRAGALKL